MKGILRRTSASHDVDSAVLYYLEQAGTSVADRFLGAYDHALLHISEFSGTGSTRYAKLFDTASLRFWTLQKFPYAVFYLELTDAVEVIRVLHQSSDIPAHLQP